MNSDELISMAICWYDKEQWELLAQLDPDGVDESYEEWRKSANKAIKGMDTRGQKLIKISIKISDLQKWCEEKGIEPNSSSRAEFAAMLAQRRSEDE